MTERENMEVPLRVRISAAEDARLMTAANKLGLTRSVYVRWALENSTTQVIGAVNQPVRVQEPAKPKRVRAAPVPAPVAVVYEEPPVPDVDSFFTAAPAAGDPVEAAFDDSEWT